MASLDDGRLLIKSTFEDGPPLGDESLLLSYSWAVSIAIFELRI